MGFQVPGGSASHDQPHHALPGRVAASESSSTAPETKKGQDKKPKKKPSRKKSAEDNDDDDEPVPSEHEPLGGSGDDDPGDDDMSGEGGDGCGIPRDLKPKHGVMKKPGARATATMKRPSKRVKKNEDWF